MNFDRLNPLEWIFSKKNMDELIFPMNENVYYLNTIFTSGVGFGQDKIPFLSTQHNAVIDPNTWTTFDDRPSNML